MLDFEKTLFEELMKSVDASDKKLHQELNGEEEKQKNELVMFSEHVEEFTGLNGEKMGAFEKGQIANISREIAKILVDDKKAEYVKD